MQIPVSAKSALNTGIGGYTKLENCFSRYTFA